jgi:hypothetical protein
VRARVQEQTATFTTAELNGVIIPYTGQARTPVNRENLQRRLRWRLLWAGCVYVPPPWRTLRVCSRLHGHLADLC